MTADTASAVSERIRFCTVYVVLFVFTKAVKSVYSVLIRIVLYSVLIRIMYCDTLVCVPTFSYSFLKSKSEIEIQGSTSFLLVRRQFKT